MIRRLTTIIAIIVCVLTMGAQTLTATYIELADSADRYIKAERWEDAERVIIKALRHEPANRSNYLLWSNLGIVRMNRGDYPGAKEAIDIGLASAPHSTTLLTNRAKANMALNHRQEAIEDLDQVLAVDSTLQWPMKMRGMLRAIVGETERAKSELTKYEERYGKDATVSETLGDISNAGGDYDEAIKRYKAAYELEGEVATLDKMLLTAYYYGKLEAESKELERGISRHPSEGLLYLLRAMLNKSRYQSIDMERDLKIANDLGVDPQIYKQIAGREGVIKSDKKR